MTADTLTKDESIRLMQAEIERLRESVKFLNSFRPDAELAKRDAEIERLRSENERLWSLCRNVYGSDKYIREALGE